MIQLVLALDPKGDADIVAAQRLLAGWDRRMAIGGRAPALAIAVATPIAKAWSDKSPAPDTRTTLTAAIADFKAHFHRIDPRWGSVNRIVRGKVDLAIDGGPDTYRAVYGETQKDGRLKAMAGDTFIMFVTWDKAGHLESESIHQFGSATLDAKSRHYADQTPLFTAMGTKPVRFTEAQLAGHIEADYAPGQAH